MLGILKDISKINKILNMPIKLIILKFNFGDNCFNKMGINPPIAVGIRKNSNVSSEFSYCITNINAKIGKTPKTKLMKVLMYFHMLFNPVK